MIRNYRLVNKTNIIIMIGKKNATRLNDLKTVFKYLRNEENISAEVK